MAQNPEESTPLLPSNNNNDNEKVSKCDESSLSAPPSPPAKQPPVPTIAQPQVAETYGWPMPMDVVGHPMVEMGHRQPWSSDLCSCLGRNDHFCSTDLEVCLLGSVAPCVLYGSNVERLGSSAGSFSNHCLSYAALYLIGNSFFGWNSLAPCFSYSSRTAVRRMFNLEGTCEALTRHCECCGSFVEDDLQREQCETACDFATHILCHPCSLCQEGREIRRRLPHPSFNAQPVVLMVPPGGQAMGRDQAFLSQISEHL